MPDAVRLWTDQRYRKLLFLGSLALMMLVPVWAIWSYVSAIVSSFTGIQDDYTRILAIESEQRAAGHLLAQTRSLETELAESGLLFAGSSTISATTQLNSEINDLMRQSNAAIRSVGVLPAAPDGGLERLEVSVNFSIPAERLPILLSRMRELRPAVFIDTLHVSNAVFGGQTGPVAVDIDLHAYRRPRDHHEP